MRLDFRPRARSISGPLSGLVVGRPASYPPFGPGTPAHEPNGWPRVSRSRTRPVEARRSASRTTPASAQSQRTWQGVSQGRNPPCSATRGADKPSRKRSRNPATADLSDVLCRENAVRSRRCESCAAGCRSSRKESQRCMEVTTCDRSSPLPKGRRLDGSASGQAVTCVNLRARIEKSDADAAPPELRGRVPATRAPVGFSGALATACGKEEASATRRWRARANPGAREGRILGPHTLCGCVATVSTDACWPGFLPPLPIQEGP